MNHITLWLSNGKKIKGYYNEDEFDGIYENWVNGNIMGFSNCCVRGNDVVLIEYHAEEK